MISAEPSRTLIIGIGNKYRSDDAVGLIVAQRLKDQISDHITILEMGNEGTAFLDSWKGAETVILIDAVHSGAEPGTLQRFEAHIHSLPNQFFHCSTHTLGVAEAIELARVLDQLPPRCIVYGIEGKNFALGEGLSPEVERAVGEVVHSVFRELQENRHITPS